jgi:hypothetical protein
MQNNAPKRLDLRMVYGVTLIVLVALAVLLWLGAQPMFND